MSSSNEALLKLTRKMEAERRNREYIRNTVTDSQLAYDTSFAESEPPLPDPDPLVDRIIQATGIPKRVFMPHPGPVRKDGTMSEGSTGSAAIHAIMENRIAELRDKMANDVIAPLLKDGFGNGHPPGFSVDWDSISTNGSSTDKVTMQDVLDAHNELLALKKGHDLDSVLPGIAVDFEWWGHSVVPGMNTWTGMPVIPDPRILMTPDPDTRPSQNPAPAQTADGTGWSQYVANSIPPQPE